MACVQRPLFPLAFLHQQRKYKTLDFLDQHGAGYVKRRTLNLGIFDSTHWNSIFQKPWSVAWKAGVIFSRFSGDRSASARRTWAGVERQTRAAFLSRDAGTWGLTKEFQDGGRKWFLSSACLVFPSLRFVAIVCLNFKARLSFFRCSTCFFRGLLILYMGFLHSYRVYASWSLYFIFHKNTN